jgi:chorismate--pyruvate lyase
MRDWLTTPGSLTARLVAHSNHFRVQRLRQAGATCMPDEAGTIGLHRQARVWERDVLLRCDGEPVVFAHTVVSASSTATDWPLFSALGERSLGTTLFYDPLVKRGQLEFARIRAGHPLLERANDALGNTLRDKVYYARRCLYRRHQGLLLVTEVFLPSVLTLAAAVPNTNTR